MQLPSGALGLHAFVPDRLVNMDGHAGSHSTFYLEMHQLAENES